MTIDPFPSSRSRSALPCSPPPLTRRSRLASAVPPAVRAPRGRRHRRRSAGLKVLLTNDDSARGLDAGFGTDGKGLYELRKALCAAGADVLVVAPWSQQSGAGARMTTPGFARCR